ncbi:hypothetical protein, partial [Gallibacterium genomosp. 3]|uniref:hypothetical protein n=1 Tax=Gallibacterium genomosp. 3 TaxID=505345 RepID=UPI001E530A50
YLCYPTATSSRACGNISLYIKDLLLGMGGNYINHFQLFKYLSEVLGKSDQERSVAQDLVLSW